MKLCKEQLDFIPWFLNSEKRINVLTGHAGSGKSTTMKALKGKGKNILWCSYTHQAKNILSRFLGTQSTITLASALGLGPLPGGKFGPKYKNKVNFCDILVVDEASMINPEQLQ